MSTNYHEEETMILKASRPWERTLLHRFLRKRGLQSVDDSYELVRKDRVLRWQSRTILSIEVFLGGEGIYETIEDIEEGEATQWDELHCKYLMATLPRECVADLVHELEALVQEFVLKMKYQSEVIGTEELSMRLNRIADQLTVDWDVPGSESLRLLIEQEYPRSR